MCSCTATDAEDPQRSYRNVAQLIFAEWRSSFRLSAQQFSKVQKFSDYLPSSKSYSIGTVCSFLVGKLLAGEILLTLKSKWYQFSLNSILVWPWVLYMWKIVWILRTVCRIIHTSLLEIQISIFQSVVSSDANMF